MAEESELHAVPEVLEESAPTVETTDDSTPSELNQDAETEQTKKTPWFEKRIGELTREKYAAKQAIEEARKEAAELRQYLETQQGNYPGQNIPELVQKEAEKLLAENSFNDKCNKIYAAGKTEFPNFDAAVANLQMVGINRDFLEAVTLSDAGHKVLNHLGNNLEEAERIANLPPLQMGRELTKLEVQLEKQTKPVSKAPDPIKPLGGTTVSTKDPDKMSDAEFAKWRREQINSRGR